jgi:hypothetical protein
VSGFSRRGCKPNCSFSLLFLMILFVVVDDDDDDDDAIVTLERYLRNSNQKVMPKFRWTILLAVT